MDVKLTSSVSELIDFEEDKITHEGGVRTNVIMKFRGVNIENNKKVYVYITIAVSNTMNISEILSLFKKKINQHYNTINYIVFLDTIDVYINKLSSSGGCENREHITRVEKKIYSLSSDESQLGEELRTFRLISPKSKDNNCLIACFINFNNLKGNQCKASKIRKECGLGIGKNKNCRYRQNCRLV